MGITQQSSRRRSFIRWCLDTKAMGRKKGKILSNLSYKRTIWCWGTESSFIPHAAWSLNVRLVHDSISMWPKTNCRTVENWLQTQSFNKLQPTWWTPDTWEQCWCHSKKCLWPSVEIAAHRNLFFVLWLIAFSGVPACITQSDRKVNLSESQNPLWLGTSASLINNKRLPFFNLMCLSSS